MTTTGEGASNIGEQNASCYDHLRKQTIWKETCDRYASHVMVAMWAFPPSVQNG